VHDPAAVAGCGERNSEVGDWLQVVAVLYEPWQCDASESIVVDGA
jgi:hypothetical protein